MAGAPGIQISPVAIHAYRLHVEVNIKFAADGEILLLLNFAAADGEYSDDKPYLLCGEHNRPGDETTDWIKCTEYQK